ncbi:MAG: PIN domain-containing protein [Gemmataceae bacterium]
MLDTNVVVALVRGNDLGRYLDATHQLTGSTGKVALSVVSVGELFALANKFGWGATRRAQLSAILSAFPLINLDAGIIAAYAEIDAASDAAGRPMGKNDVWIAATARVIDATVLTTDRDFDHLHGVWVDREWVDPDSRPGA